jgi:hypothetical protein
MSNRRRHGSHLVSTITSSILGSAVALSAVYVMFRSIPELIRYLRMRRM